MRNNYKTMRLIANTLLSGDIHKAAKLCSEVNSLATGEPMSDRTARSWRMMSAWLGKYATNPSKAPLHPHTIWAQGNGKLPFLSFSSLHGEGFCPGAGECLKWCYSATAWRYPSAFLRMVGNYALSLTKEGRQEILNEWDKKVFKIQILEDTEKPVDCRLYVDGDFGNIENLKFWMEAISARPEVNVYGYSKSLKLFVEAGTQGVVFPDNYVLNLSSGHRYGKDVEVEVSKLQTSSGKQLVRGAFKALKIDGRHGATVRPRAARKALYAAHKASADPAKAFVCPGLCGDCVKVEGVNHHACGDRDIFQDYSILIPVH